MRFQTSGAGEDAVIVGKLVSGRTVTITLYDLSDGTTIALTSNACTEIGTTGLYRFPLSNITTTPTTFLQIGWQMEDSSTGALDQGVMTVGGFPDSVDATISSRESEASAASRASTNQTEHDATQADIAALPDVVAIADGVWEEALADHSATVGSTAEAVAEIQTDVNAILVDTNTTIPGLIAALNDLSQADVQSAMTAQGYTTARAALIDNLDQTISSIATLINALNDLDATAVSNAVWDSLRSSHTTAETMGSAMTILLNAMASRGLIDTSTNPWQEVRYTFDETDVGADGDTVVAERYDLYDQDGNAINGSSGSGNNPLNDATVIIAERRRV